MIHSWYCLCCLTLCKNQSQTADQPETGWKKVRKMLFIKCLHHPENGVSGYFRRGNIRFGELWHRSFHLIVSGNKTALTVKILHITRYFYGSHICRNAKMAVKSLMLLTATQNTGQQHGIYSFPCVFFRLSWPKRCLSISGTKPSRV